MEQEHSSFFQKHTPHAQKEHEVVLWENDIDTEMYEIKFLFLLSWIASNIKPLEGNFISSMSLYESYFQTYYYSPEVLFSEKTFFRNMSKALRSYKIQHAHTRMYGTRRGIRGIAYSDRPEKKELQYVDNKLKLSIQF
jgi:hypothetical protein